MSPRPRRFAELWRGTRVVDWVREGPRRARRRIGALLDHVGAGRRKESRGIALSLSRSGAQCRWRDGRAFVPDISMRNDSVPRCRISPARHGDCSTSVSSTLHGMGGR
jgi:hypothetical protein